MYHSFKDVNSIIGQSSWVRTGEGAGDLLGLGYTFTLVNVHTLLLTDSYGLEGVSYKIHVSGTPTVARKGT